MLRRVFLIQLQSQSRTEVGLIKVVPIRCGLLLFFNDNPRSSDRGKKKTLAEF